MKQQLIVSGLGGQGVLFLTGIIAEAAVRSGPAGADRRNPRHGPARRKRPLHP